MELLILLQMKFGNIFEFSLIIFGGISEYWDAFFNFNMLISVSVSLKLTSPKLKASFRLHLALIAGMLAFFSYISIAFKVGSFSIIGSKLEKWEMSRFFTILPNELLKTSAFSFSALIILPLSLRLILSLCH